MIKSAVIAGHDSNIWASSTGFNVTSAELKVVLDRYADTDLMAMNGVVIGGLKYMFLSANDREARRVPHLSRLLRLNGAGHVPKGCWSDWLKLLAVASTWAQWSPLCTESINIFYVFSNIFIIQM